MASPGFRSRIIGLRADPGGRVGKMAAYSCGLDFNNGDVFQSRLIDLKPDGSGQLRKVFASPSECHHPSEPGQAVTNFSSEDCAPPFGISNVVELLLVIDDGIVCWGDICIRTSLTGGGGSWTGIGHLNVVIIELEFQCLPGGVAKLILTGPCVDGGSATLLGTAATLWPYKAGGASPINLIASCCGFVGPPKTLDVAWTIFGLTFDRYSARLVSLRPGKGGVTKVFAIHECCAPFTCQAGNDCCGCTAYPRQWAFTVSGVTNGTCEQCGDFNVDWTVTYVGACLWKSQDSGICTPGESWTLFCDGANWVLCTSSFGGGAACYELAVESWACFGPNVMTKISDHGACNSFPGAITLNAV